MLIVGTLRMVAACPRDSATLSLLGKLLPLHAYPSLSQQHCCALPQVLDAIDTGSSALIVAPTSSGKTFISSYCINAVVRAEGDPQGLVVFVAPTKPLVNQVAAQVGRQVQPCLEGVPTSY